MMEWKTVYMPRTAAGRPCQDGHKVFMCIDSDEVAVADWSGHYPHETEDGVLYVPTTGVATVGLSQSSNEVLCSVPVWKLRDKRMYSILTTLDTLRVIQQYVPGMQASLSEDAAKMLSQLLPYAHLVETLAGAL